jgi:hypothetical protein
MRHQRNLRANLAVLSVLHLLGFIASAQQGPRRLITKCWQDIGRLDLREDSSQIEAAGPDGLSVRLDYKQGKFSVRREARTVFSLSVDDLSTNAEVLWAPDGKAFVLDYSDGGAIGRFHVRVFMIDGDTVTDVSHAVDPAVTAFKVRHFCKTRGNNVTALKWLHESKDLVLMTEVYPTGDCGPDLGHAEGYIVAVPDGEIERHLSLNELKNIPRICLQNEEQ